MQISNCTIIFKLHALKHDRPEVHNAYGAERPEDPPQCHRHLHPLVMTNSLLLKIAMYSGFTD